MIWARKPASGYWYGLKLPAGTARGWRAFGRRNKRHMAVSSEVIIARLAFCLGYNEGAKPAMASIRTKSHGIPAA